MPTFDQAQISAWLAPVFWPFVRTLALFAVAPVFSQRAVPLPLKIGLALLIAICAQPVLGAQAVIGFDSPQALGALVQQIGVGLAVGFAARLVFAALELAGEVVGLQMGLNFAAFFDPTSNAQLSAVARFWLQIGTLVFIAINGHWLVLLALLKSFAAFPVDGSFLHAAASLHIHTLGSAIFSSALWLALPLIAMLGFVNMVLGIISRVAPQMNVYAIGFPLTLSVGLVGLWAVLPLLASSLSGLLERSLDALAL